jgi:hypothetical protein
MMQFFYVIKNNGVDCELICNAEYDYSTDRGPEACLTSARVPGGKFDLLERMSKIEVEEAEDYFLENLYAIDQENTHNSLKRDNEL